MTQADFIEQGYEPRFTVSDPYYIDAVAINLTVDIYDNSLPRKDFESQVLFRVELDNPKKADKFVELATEMVNQWEIDDGYYEFEDPYQDYVRNELIAMKGKYICET